MRYCKTIFTKVEKIKSVENLVEVVFGIELIVDDKVEKLRKVDSASASAVRDGTGMGRALMGRTGGYSHLRVDETLTLTFVDAKPERSQRIVEFPRFEMPNKKRASIYFISSRFNYYL